MIGTFGSYVADNLTVGTDIIDKTELWTYQF